MNWLSKPVKNSKEWDKPITKWDRLRCWFWDTTLFHYYDKWTWKFIWKPIRDVKKMWQWYWNVFENEFDFDSIYIYKILSYKLKRLLNCLEKGHLAQDPMDIKALKLAIKLADRLHMDQIYFDIPHDRHDKKWGKSKSWFTKIKGTDKKPGGPYSKLNSKRAKAVTKKQKEQERKEYLKIIELEDFLRKRDECWFHGIVMKYRRNWWD